MRPRIAVQLSEKVFDELRARCALERVSLSAKIAEYVVTGLEVDTDWDADTARSIIAELSR